MFFLKMKLPKGTYLESCEKPCIIDGRLHAGLKRKDGKYNQDTFKLDGTDTLELANCDGYFAPNQSIIPKKIFQTHKSWEYVESKKDILDAVNSWRVDGFEYNFYNNDDCEKFILENFDENVYVAYKKCPVPVMQADLWRYCVIYKYGGIYADSDTICCNDPRILLRNSQLVITPESDNVHLCQWVFAAPAGSPILKSIIDLSVERILRKRIISGPHIIHELTGPGVFTDGIEKYLQENYHPVFMQKRRYSDYPDSVLHVFDFWYFNTYIVKHLFAGCKEDGWKNFKP